MKIGIVTFHRAINYGAVIQAWALTQFLIESGHEAKIVDYFPRYYSKASSALSKKRFGLNRHNLIRLRFWKFRKEWMQLSSRLYASFGELQRDNLGMDAYICGSDQIWNPSLTGGDFDPVMFLAFAGQGTRRIAYGPSLGQAELSPEYLPKLKTHLANLDHISAREDSAVSIIRSLGFPATEVIDPALLPSSYASISRPRRKGSYILAYQVIRDHFFEDVAHRVSKALRLPIVMIGWGDSCVGDSGITATVTPTPNEWIGLFENASAVVTNSFHGTLFSVLFKRNFVTTALHGREAAKNVRLVDILDKLGLSKRLFPSEDGCEPEDILRVETDWDSVEYRLSLLRKCSREFLLNALG